MDGPIAPVSPRASWPTRTPRALTAVNCTLGYVAGPRSRSRRACAAIGQYDALIRATPNDLIKVLTAADIRRAKAGRRSA